MKNEVKLNFVDKFLLYFSSVYLIITGFISLWFIFILIDSDLKLQFLIIITISVALFIIGLTLWTNSVMLSKIGFMENSQITMNLIICLIQSFSFFLNGFCYKYTQGLESVGFLHVHQLTNEFELRMFPPKLTFDALFNFRSTNGIYIAVNFIMLPFLLFFIYIKRKYFKLSAFATPVYEQTYK